MILWHFLDRLHLDEVVQTVPSKQSHGSCGLQRWDRQLQKPQIPSLGLGRTNFIAVRFLTSALIGDVTTRTPTQWFTSSILRMNLEWRWPSKSSIWCFRRKRWKDSLSSFWRISRTRKVPSRKRRSWSLSICTTSRTGNGRSSRSQPLMGLASMRLLNGKLPSLQVGRRATDW